MKFRPTQDYILVRPLLRAQSSILEVVSYERHCRGEVVAVGPGKKGKNGKIKPLDVQPGDIIAFGDGSGTLDNCYPTITVDNIQYRILQQADICFIEEPTVDAMVAEMLSRTESPSAALH